jgi:hypothetical protein
MKRCYRCGQFLATRETKDGRTMPWVEVFFDRYVHLKHPGEVEALQEVARLIRLSGQPGALLAGPPEREVELR